MASGSFSNNVDQNCNLTIQWSSTPGNGGSTVTATLIAQNRNNWYFSATVYGYGITINGSQVTGSGAGLSGSYNGSASLISHSVWVPYTGDKSITISGYANFNGIYTLSNQTISGNVALDKIGSKPTMGNVTAPATATMSELTKTITVQWNKASSYNNSVTYAIGCSINGGSYNWVYPNNNINTTSYDWNIGTPKQGDTYQFAVVCANDIARSDIKYSGKITINKVNQPTIGNISTYNPFVTSSLTVPLTGGGQTISGGKIYRMADLYYGDTKLASCTTPTSDNNTSVAITYSSANYISQLGIKKYTDEFKIIAWVQNENGTKSNTVTSKFTVNINSDGNATPTLGAPTLSGGAFSNPSTCFVAGVSTLTVASATASLRRAPSGTTITYSISCTGFESSKGTTVNFTGLTAGTKTITVTATDSRGLSTSVTKNCIVQSYAPPSIKAFTTNRLTDPNTSAKLVYTLSYSPIYQYTDVNTKGNQLNGISAQQYKKNSFDWATASNNLVLTNLSTDSVYTISLRVSDKLRSTTYTTATQQVTTIKTGMAIRDWGIGIGCVPQSVYRLEVGGASHFTNAMFLDGDLSLGGRILANGRSSSWVYGRINSIVRTKSINGYSPLASIKTTNGSWEIGAYDNDNSTDQLLFTHVTDENYNTATNKATKQFTLNTGYPSKNGLLTVNDIYPVGSVILSMNSTNPGTRFPGTTWVQIGQGRTLVGQGTGNDGTTEMAFSNSGATGGEYKHKLTVSELASHTHKMALNRNDVENSNYGLALGTVGFGGRVMISSDVNLETKSSGSNGLHNNVQPYIVVYFWQRTV